MTSLTLDTSHARELLGDELFEPYLLKAADAWQTLTTHSGPGNDFLGWLDLPGRIREGEAARITELSARLAGKAEVLVVIGIGGSYLGARAVIEALSPGIGLHGSKGMRIVYAGHHMGEAYHRELLSYLDGKEYAVCVISKSGTTTEPALAFRMIKQHIEEKYGREEASRRIVAITDSSKGALRPLADALSYESFVIPDDVGGRFSVFTPVGLLPIAAAGHDIDALLAGADSMREHCYGSPSENLASQYAAHRNALYHAGYSIEVLAAFLPELQFIGEWFKQLYGESEGKGGKGIFPASVNFSTDLHSMGQYIQDGKRQLFETFLSVDEQDAGLRVTHAEGDPDKLNYLEGRNLHAINLKAEQGTVMAHHDGQVPVMSIGMPRIDERTVGELLYFFEFACGVSAYMLGVNPFDQPGVEAYKRNMFKLLGKPGL